MITIEKYSAVWCSPCKMLANNLEKILKEYPEVELKEIDIEDNVSAAKDHQIKSVPTLIFYKDGQEINKIVGNQRIDVLRSLISNALI